MIPLNLTKEDVIRLHDSAVSWASQNIANDWLTMHDEIVCLENKIVLGVSAIINKNAEIDKLKAELTRIENAIEGAMEEMNSDIVNAENKAVPYDDEVGGYISGIACSLDILRRHLGKE